MGFFFVFYFVLLFFHGFLPILETFYNIYNIYTQKEDNFTL